MGAKKIFSPTAILVLSTSVPACLYERHANQTVANLPTRLTRARAPLSSRVLAHMQRSSQFSCIWLFRDCSSCFPAPSAQFEICNQLPPCAPRPALCAARPAPCAFHLPTAL